MKDKINTIQFKIKQAIANIEKEENVKITFGNISYNSAYYTSKIKVTSLDDTPEVKKVFKSECASIGLPQNVIGMKFRKESDIFEITEIKLRNRKYPVIAKNTSGKFYKFSVSSVKMYIGGDKIINRNKNLENLLK